jgi:hypothetical protein
MQIGSERIPLMELRAPQMTLEDAFIALTSSAESETSPEANVRKNSAKE